MPDTARGHGPEVVPVFVELAGELDRAVKDAEDLVERFVACEQTLLGTSAGLRPEKERKDPQPQPGFADRIAGQVDRVQQAHAALRDIVMHLERALGRPQEVVDRDARIAAANGVDASFRATRGLR